MFDIREVCAGGSPKCKGFKGVNSLRCKACSNTLTAATRKPRTDIRMGSRWPRMRYQGII
jgi:hypothetical protein